LTGNRALPDEAARLYRELWISLASVVQSYAAAALLAAPEESYECSRLEDDRLSIRTKHKQLLLSCDCTAGDGRWEVRSSGAEVLAKGWFSLNALGLVSVDGHSSVELDAAAEVLAAKIL